MTKKKYDETHKLNLFSTSDKPHINDSIRQTGKLIGLVRREQYTTLGVLLFNLFVLHSGCPLRVYRARKSLGSKRYNPSGIGYSSINTVLDKLIKYELINHEIGYKNLNTGEGKTTAITTTHKLQEMFIKDSWTRQDINWINSETVKLRKPSTKVNNKTKKGELVDYIDGGYTTWLRGEMEKYNELLSKTFINVGDEYFDDFHISRIFIDYGMHNSNGETLFSFGGRMHAPWCDLSSEYRKGIHINDEETVEIDYQAAHVNALYKFQMGHSYNKDPYHLIINEHTIPRHIVKRSAVIMTNTTSYRSAVTALENQYKSESDELKIDEYTAVKREWIIKPSDIMRAYLKKHKDIAFFYLKGKLMGSRIQFIESEMLFEVVQKLTHMQIPVLTVYDSFIIQKHYAPLVKKLMKETHFINRKEIVKLMNKNCLEAHEVF